MRHIFTPSRILAFGLAIAFNLLTTCDSSGQQGNADQAEAEISADHATAMAASRQLFRSDVRQIFVGRCLSCHGGESTEAEFSLASRTALMRGGESGQAIEIQDVPESRLLRMIRHQVEPVMPEDGAKLDDRQIDAIEKWIRLGAAYDQPLRVESSDDPLAWTKRVIDDATREFWSFQPLAVIPTPEKRNGTWARTAIDDFILEQLTREELAPNEMASRNTLVRRAYLDLIGLPPTSTQTAAFLADQDPQAYEKLIDRLLANKHHGERVARHWLDIVRFGESHGFEQDYDRPHAYHYRDFVIKAFNQDMPFDQFVRWQLAGDEIAPDDPLAMMATGFLGAGVFPTQLTEKEFESARYDELDDMVATLGSAMLGITIGCARCHDHKFDPIPARDYYQLVSAFRHTIRSNVEIDLNKVANRQAMQAWQTEIDSRTQKLRRFEDEELASRWEEFIDSLKPPTERSETHWVRLRASRLLSEQGATFVRLDDGSYLATGKNGVSDAYIFETETSLSDLKQLRIEALADDSMKASGPGRAANGNFALSRITVTARPTDSTEEPVAVELINPQVSFEQNSANLSIQASLDNNPKTGWAVDPKFGQNHAATFNFQEAVGFPQGTHLTIRLEFQVNDRHNIGRLRVAVSNATETPPIDGDAIDQATAELEVIKRRRDELKNGEMPSWAVTAFKNQDSRWHALQQAVETQLAAKPLSQLTNVMVSSENVKPIPNHGDGRGYPHFYENVHFLNRGDIDQKQGIAELGFPQVLMRNADSERWRVQKLPQATTSSRRRAVAAWITDVDHGAGSLLARVIVNRLWQQHFGRGLVATPNDFGFQGQRPTNPELLDWLAAELIRNQWRLKPIRKLIMTSSVYMQRSDFNNDHAAKDPINQWQWRFSPRRMEAEIIRDAMLAVSGEWDTTQYGPGTLNESMRRRSIYFMIKRSRLIPIMQVFDSPEPLVSVGKRPSTTIAPQALVFMNHPQVREYAHAFAKKIANQDLNVAIEQAYMTALSRSPSEQERSDSITFVRRQTESYSADSSGLATSQNGEAVDFALADLCQVLMSLNEFVYLN
ncbi:MAG: PSD1 and planctomycete cytochrome C domain-containing protein [Rubripirellula sp.]|nr:PSD1 and planctomycete cytochrome C domain-containing protein [Rubripirellula sp.]